MLFAGSGDLRLIYRLETIFSSEVEKVEVIGFSLVKKWDCSCEKRPDFKLEGNKMLWENLVHKGKMYWEKTNPFQTFL